jgi:type IV pilus assembly protein PilB
MSRHGFVGDLLIQAGITEADGLARAIELQSTQPSSIGRALASLGLADESRVAETIAAALRLECLVEDPEAVDDDVAALLPAEFCRKRRAMPLSLDGNLLRLAVTDPLDYSLFQDVEFRTGKKIVAVVVTETWLERMLLLQYPDRAPAYDLLASVDPAGEIETAAPEEYDLVDPATLLRDTNLPPIVRLVNLILSDAARARASDVHIEPQETSVLVRQRVDGLLHEVLTIPLHLRDQVVSRVKIISGMDIAERRKPQDGRSRLRYESKRIDLRVSTLPTQFGEKVVIRLLSVDTGALPLDEIGFSPENLTMFRSLLSRPQGMILVTGPTGSGKTSTLYSALNSIKQATNNIITLEDPIEYQIEGVNQVQLNTRAGVTFAAGLRSILRQDPNVILVGEIRDQETAEVALRAAQTGHLLLSTVHTNDAPATITRLFDLGIQPYVVASSLLGVVAQRLVRRPCQFCVAPRRPGDDIVEKAGGWSKLPEGGEWVAGRGCEQCRQFGMKGRIAIHEVLHVNDEVRSLITRGAPEHETRAAARRAGMRSMFEDGVAKAAQGLTTLEAVLKVASPEVERAPAVRAAADVGSIEDSAARPPAVTSQPEPVAQLVPATGHADRRRVLVVEDSATVSSVVRYFLELEGFEVSVAPDGRLGLEMALRDSPDVIVSDVNMPQMTGVELVRALRADPRGAGVRVLMLTSESSVESETEGLAAGADDYILKPVEPRRLAARVRALLGRAQPSTSRVQLGT